MKWYIFGLVGAMLVSLLGLAMIILNATPETASGAVKTLYFAALFLFVWTTTTLAGVYIQSWRMKRKRKFLRPTDINSVARIAFLVSTIFLVILLLRKFL